MKSNKKNSIADIASPAALHYQNLMDMMLQKNNLKLINQPTVNKNELDSKQLLRVLSEVKNGNFDVRMPIDEIGISGKICDTLNDIIILNATLVEELESCKKCDRQ
jgi:hypothetical protein